MKLIAVIILAGATTLGGCSLVAGNSDYGCRGMPDSVTCMSVPEVYELTQGDDYRERVQEVSKQQMSGKYKKDKKETSNTVQATEPAATAGQYVPVPAVTANPQPIRTPSEVMRILIYPYESTDGDLIVPGYIYTEIEPRRWEVGVRPSSVNSLMLSPLVMPRKPEAASGDQEAKDKKNADSERQKKVKPFLDK